MLAKLIQLLADGLIHHHEELTTSLKISHRELQQLLSGLSELGLHNNLPAVNCYQLERPLILLSSARIDAALNDAARSLLTDLKILQQVDSTNRYLLDYSNNLSSGIACFAEYQTAGKGRQGRQWVSPFGHNIYLSIRWNYPSGLAAITGLSLAVGVAVMRVLSQYQLNHLGLKWPNDIVYRGKKLAGILVEATGSANGSSVVIGLGLNLFMPSKEGCFIQQAWTDLNTLCAPAPDRNLLAANLLNQLLPVIASYETHGIKAYLEEWRRYDALIDLPATLYLGSQCFTGIVRGIDDEGLLLLEHQDGKIIRYASGEVSFNQSDQQ